MRDLLKKTVNEMVTADERTAGVFEKYAIDFCCNGGRTLEAACAARGVDPEVVLKDLGAIESTPVASTRRVDEWDLGVLIRHIIDTHHRYVRQTLPVIQPHLAKVLSSHGARYPELADIAGQFHSIAQELMMHMEKEEKVLFPYIESLVAAASRDVPPPVPPFGSIRNPIRMMEREHQAAGDAFETIRSVSKGYEPPRGACTTLIVTYRELEQFERDLHRHIHLENAILFPKAIAMEERMLV